MTRDGTPEMAPDRLVAAAADSPDPTGLTDLEARLRPVPLAPAGPPDLAGPASAEGVLDVAFATTDSPLGRLVLAATNAGLVTCSFGGDESALAERLARALSPRVLRAPRLLDPARRELDAYFEGRLREFSLRVDLALTTPFGRTVLDRLRRVPYGATTTYGRLAAEIGKPGAARAVGNALNTNPVAVVVPCHRVIGANGTLTGYAGGLPAKRLLLDLEARGAWTRA
ncbi:MAG: methylated-DNA--[protein]-cysteine S-methyltransferase [Carbonactinosporaceae bacterium]